MKLPKLTPTQERELFKKKMRELGALGGKKSKRKITPEQQRAMQEARKAKKENRQ